MGGWAIEALASIEIKRYVEASGARTEGASSSSNPRPITDHLQDMHRPKSNNTSIAQMHQEIQPAPDPTGQLTFLKFNQNVEHNPTKPPSPQA
jgi:hypothetical protein